MVLYINGNYPHHSLHSELVARLADLGEEITVFVPMNGTQFDGKYSIMHPGVTLIYSDCLGFADRLFFLHKVRIIVREIEKRIDMTKVSCILAGTVYSDGSAAYLLHRKYGIPFSVAVRQTDVSYQMKWRPYLNGFIRNLLKQASRIIFLSPAYQTSLDRLGCNQDKRVIIPNAVNDFWFSRPDEPRKMHHPLSLIFVGEISKNKNVRATISAVAELKKAGTIADFHIVGSGDEENEYRQLAAELDVAKQVYFHGWQDSKEKISGFYDQADIFVMLSFRESFGTVYIEALSQGLPVVYTRGQGIDGFFGQGSIGYACDPQDVNEITTAIQTIREHYETMSAACIRASKHFQWKAVAKQYKDVIDAMRDQ